MRLPGFERKDHCVSWLSPARAPAWIPIARALLCPLLCPLLCAILGALLCAPASAQTVQTTASIPDTSSGTPKPLAMAVNPTTDAVFTINSDGSILYINGSLTVPAANPAGACSAATLDSLGTTALAASSNNEAFFYANGDLDAVTGAVGSCSSGTVPITTTTVLPGGHSPLLATDSGLGYVYAVSANLSASSTDQLEVVNAHTGAIVATVSLGVNATYSSIVVDPTSHLVFVSDTTSSVIYVYSPTTAPNVMYLTGYSGTLFVQPLISPFSASQLVVAGSTVVNLFSIPAIQSAISSSGTVTADFSGTYAKTALGSTGPSDTGVALKSPLLDTVNGVLYGALNGAYEGDLPEETLYSVALSTLQSNANSTTAVGTEVGVLDTFNPGSTSAPNTPYALALVPNPSATAYPKIFAVQTGGVSFFAPTDANVTGIQLFDTSPSNTRPITATTVPLTLTCPSAGVPPSSTCKLLPSEIVVDPTNNNVYVSGNLAYGTTSLTSVTDYYVDVVQTPVNLLCSTPVTTTSPVAGAPTSLTVYLCTSTGTPITSPAYAGTVHFTSSDPKAILPANYTFQTSDAGSHTFTGVVLETSGSQSISFADTVTSTTEGSAAYTVSAAGAASLTASAGTPQYAVAGTAYGTPLAATVADAYGNGVPGVLVSFVAPATGASGTFAGTTLVQTGSTGIAVAPALTANGTAGAFSVTATATGVSQPVTFSLANKPSLPVAMLVPGIISTLHSDAGTAGSIPAALAFDNAGNLYVLDSGLSTVTEYPVGGGSAVKIVPQTGQSVTLNTPSDMVLDATGNSLLISDYANNRLVRVTLGSTVTTTALTLTGVPSVSTTCPNPISGTSLCLPTGVGEDGAGDIFVSDNGNGRVLKLTSVGAYISTPATSGSFGTLSPEGLAVDPGGDVWIANDTGTSSGGILKVTAAGVESSVPDGGNESPFGLALDGAGEVYLTSPVQTTSAANVIDAAGVVLPFAGDGVTTDSGDGGAATSAGIAGPLGITLDGKGDALIADSVESSANGGAIREVNGSASAVVFPSTTDGLTSAVKTVMLLNAGPAPLTISSVVSLGANPADFPLTNACGSSLAAGQSCALSFVFSPTIVGAESAVISITDNSGGTVGTTQNVALSGTGAALPMATPPMFLVPSGSYNSIQLVTFGNTLPPGATIYYTTNGTAPTTSSTKYTGTPISVGVSETIEAIATATGYQNSTVATATYIITLTTAPTPTFSPAAGPVAAGSTVTITAGGASIYYAINATPTTSTTPCASPCSVALGTLLLASETIEAIAVVPGYNNSPVASATYILEAGTPTFTLTPSPATLSLTAGATTGNTSAISVAQVYGFTGSVTLSCSVTGPTGATSPATCGLNPSTLVTVPGGAATTLTAGTTATTTPGIYMMTVIGTSGTTTVTTTVNVTVTSAASFTFLATSTNPSVFINSAGNIVGTLNVPAPEEVTVTLTLTSLNGYNSAVTVSINVGVVPFGVDVAPPPTVECVDVNGTPLLTSIVAGNIVCVPYAPYIPTSAGTPVYVTFTYTAIPKPMASRMLASKGESRAASGGLAVSLVALLMGSLAGRRRLLANAVKFMAMVCMIVSLAVLVGACGGGGGKASGASGDLTGTTSGASSLPVESTITATPASGPAQTVSIYTTFTNGSI